jgi:hypothetical protein
LWMRAHKNRINGGGVVSKLCGFQRLGEEAGAGGWRAGR